MKKIIFFSLLVLFFASCSEEEPIVEESNIVELSYYEEISNEYHKNKIFTILAATPIVKLDSLNVEIDLIQITARTTHDDSYVLFEVYANKIGDKVLYNNVFTFRTSRGTPYSAAVFNLQVSVNNDTEFIADFSGTLDHYNQHVPVYIFLNISSGSIKFTY